MNAHVYKYYCYLWANPANDPMDLFYIRQWIQQEIDFMEILTGELS